MRKEFKLSRKLLLRFHGNARLFHKTMYNCEMNRYLKDIPTTVLPNTNQQKCIDI